MENCFLENKILGLGLVNKELLKFTQKEFWATESRVDGSGLDKELKQIRELCNCRSPTCNLFIYLFYFKGCNFRNTQDTRPAFIYLFIYFIVIDMIDNMSIHSTCHT
jgi:hypothetical protein